MTAHRPPLVLLFLGPTLDAESARQALAGTAADVRVSPPAQQGDVLRALGDRPDVIGLVDGLFFQVPSVTHKEVLLALERGVRILGSSSMGALRAAELDRFGMEGVGEIYHAYRSGAIDGDDEVALVHDESFRPLTVALVTLRHSLRRARARRVISARAARAVLASARRLHFTERTMSAVLDGTGEIGAVEAAALRAHLDTDGVDLKADDARLLLATIAARIGGRAPWPPLPVVRVQRTVYLHLLQREYDGTGPHQRLDLPDARVLAFVKLLAASAPALVRRVRRRCLHADEAVARGLDHECEAELLARFRSARRLSDDDLDTWSGAHGLSSDELAAALRLRALETRVLDGSDGPEVRAAAAGRHGFTEPELTRPSFQPPGIPWEGPLMAEAKIGGEFATALATATDLARRAARLAAGIPGLADSLGRERLEHWAAGIWGVPAAEFDTAFLDRGFTDYAEFDDVARAAYLGTYAG